jgi:hypothetical protein
MFLSIAVRLWTKAAGQGWVARKMEWVEVLCEGAQWVAELASRSLSGE